MRRDLKLSHRVALNTTLLSLGRLAIAASGLVGVAVSTRDLGRDGFGELTLALVFVSVFMLISEAGLYTTATREMAQRPDDERRLAANVFTIGLVLTAAMVGLALAAMLLLYGDQDRSRIREGILILLVPLLAAAPGGVASAYLNARQRAVPAFVGGVLSGVIFTATLGAVVWLDLGFTGFAVAYGLSTLLSVVTPLAFAIRHVPLRLARDRELWRSLIRASVPQAGVLILGVLYFRIDTFLISFLRSDSEVALYGLAYKIIEVLTLIPAYFMVTLFPEIARAQPHSPRLGELVQGAFSSIALAAIPLLVLLAGFAPQVVEIAGGPRFAAAVPVLRMLSLAVALLYLGSVFSHTLVALGQQAKLFALMMAVLAVNIGLNLLLIPAGGALGAAGAVVLSELLGLAFGIGLYRRSGALPRLHQGGRLLLAGAAMAAVAAAVGALPLTQELSPIVVLAVGAPVALAVYALAVHLLHAVPAEFAVAIAPLRTWLAQR